MNVFLLLGPVCSMVMLFSWGRVARPLGGDFRWTVWFGAGKGPRLRSSNLTTVWALAVTVSMSEHEGEDTE